MGSEMKNEISTELLQAVHDYLLTRPMLEVEGLVGALRKECTPESGPTMSEDPAVT